MVNLTFGEQVKIILSRKGMTIKELAEQVEAYTGKPMSRQNMTQKLGRDNFQEQDMRLIAKILGCQFSLSIMEVSEDTEMLQEVQKVQKSQKTQKEAPVLERDITIGELVEMAEEVCREDPKAEEAVTVLEEKPEKPAVIEAETPEVKQREEEKNLLRRGIKGYFRKSAPTSETASAATKKEESIVGDINPYTGKEYQSNSVRMHPKRIGYVQVYDQEQHKWTDMTEWAFLGYQERKKLLLGKDYRPPIYLD